MTLKISVEEAQGILSHLAYYIGPATTMFLKILKESEVMIDWDWYLLVKRFSEISDSSILEESCYQAMKQGINNMSKFQNLVGEVESKESV